MAGFRSKCRPALCRSGVRLKNGMPVQHRRYPHQWRAAPRLCDGRYEWAYVYAVVRSVTGEDMWLVMPEVSTGAMSAFLAAFAQALPAGQHAVTVLNRAG